MTLRRLAGAGLYYLSVAVILLGLAACLFFEPILEWPGP